jgi:hypothetical protein
MDERGQAVGGESSGGEKTLKFTFRLLFFLESFLFFFLIFWRGIALVKKQRQTLTCLLHVRGAGSP